MQAAACCAHNSGIRVRELNSAPTAELRLQQSKHLSERFARALVQLVDGALRRFSRGCRLLRRAWLLPKPNAWPWLPQAQLQPISTRTSKRVTVQGCLRGACLLTRHQRARMDAVMLCCATTCNGVQSSSTKASRALVSMPVQHATVRATAGGVWSAHQLFYPQRSVADAQGSLLPRAWARYRRLHRLVHCFNHV